MISDKTIKRFDEANVIDMYNSGMTYAEILNKLNTGYNQLHLYFILKNVQPRRAAKRKSIRPKAPKGETFGLWTVVSDEVKAGTEINSDSKDRALYWLVLCKCGHLSWKNPQHLKDGTSTRCKKCGNKSYLTKDGEVEINAILLSKFRSILLGLPNRKKVSLFDFNITPEYLTLLYNENNKCALSGIDLTIDLTKTVLQQNVSIDRIDSNNGYVKGNILLVDKRINMMKGTLDNQEFIDLCCKVAEKHGWSKCE